MNRTITQKAHFVACLLAITIQAYSQQFTKITSGAIVTDAHSSFTASWADIDNDGDLDMFVGNVYSENDNLYMNNGNGTFTKITSDIIANDSAFSLGATWGDYDNDGDLDLFVPVYNGKCLLYRNDLGSFTKITSGTIVNDIFNSFSAAWGDYDNDGFVDLFIANAVNQKNSLYHNNGDGTFTKITSGSIVNDLEDESDCKWIDYDNDGFLDLQISNFAMQNNSLYHNDGNGIFTKITTGSLVNDGGNSSGASWGDIDNDGDFDVYISNSFNENNFLYLNNGNGTFTKDTSSIITKDGGTSMGSGWADYDNDGDLDLFVANTSVQSTTQHNFLYRNDGNTNFTKITSGALVSDVSNSRGVAWGDYDNDGDLDLYVTNELSTPNFLFKNDAIGNNWINIKCVGITSNKAAIGTKIKIKAVINGTPTWQVRAVSSLSGYVSNSSLNTHFGLGNAAVIDSIIVNWPSGTICYFTNVAANKYYTVIENCTIYQPSNISGYVYHDTDTNCTKDTYDKPLAQRLVKLTPGPVYSSTDTTGKYNIQALPGTYTLSLLPTKYWSQTCPDTLQPYNIVVSDPNGQVIAGKNFANIISVYCPELSVDISTPFVRRCFNTNYHVQYCNKGTATAKNINIKIQFDNDILPTSASLPWTSQTGNIYTFNIDSVLPGNCGTFYITTYVSCNALLGSTRCVKANIYPDTVCSLPSPGWDKSSVKVKGSCVNDSLACFTIINTGAAGQGNMQGTSPYRIYKNNTLVYSGTFQLAGGDSVVICWPASGNTIRLEADQRPGHPGFSHPKASVEMCGNNPSDFVLGQIIVVPEDDQDNFVEMDCKLVTGSYDPNEKLVKPTGLTNAHYIDSMDVLEYQVNFQNTGTDTAFTVVILDTLSDFLDITTVESGSSSHPYSFRIFGKNILEWKFNNILLVDSNTNEPASHGFVKFKAGQLKYNSLGTTIKNSAGIIFDFNAPVITNVTINKVGDITSITDVKQLSYYQDIKIDVYPNPANDYLHVIINSPNKSDTYLFELYDVLSQRVRIATISSEKIIVQRNNLASGMYIFKVTQNGELVGSGRFTFK